MHGKKILAAALGNIRRKKKKLKRGCNILFLMLVQSRSCSLPLQSSMISRTIKIVSLTWFSAKSSEIWDLHGPKKSSLVATSPENKVGGRQGRCQSAYPHGVIKKKETLCGFGNLWLFLSSGTFFADQNKLQETHRKGEAGFSCRQGKH